MRILAAITGNKRWRIALLVITGIALGMFIVAVRISNATSYLNNESETCLNCHVMANAYATWSHGSHGRVTVCNDCHVPHATPVAKVGFKAMDGARHSYVFTLNKQPQVLRLNDAAVPVVQSNCVRCHSKQLLMIRLAESDERPCWDCHRNIHGDVQSLSASPHARNPVLPSAGIPLGKPGGKEKDNE